MQNNFYFKGNFSNIYKKTSKFSEVTSQILYGEKFKILSKKKDWIKIKTSFDNYVGYIKNTQYVKKFKPSYKVSNLKAKIYKKPNFSTKNWLPLGSKLSIIDENKKLEQAQTEAEKNRKELFNNYIADGKKNWEKNKSHFKGSYISEDMVICSKLVEDQ